MRKPFVRIAMAYQDQNGRISSRIYRIKALSYKATIDLRGVFQASTSSL